MFRRLLVPRFYRIEANIEEVPRIRRGARRGASTPSPQPGRRNTHRFDGFVALVSLEPGALLAAAAAFACTPSSPLAPPTTDARTGVSAAAHAAPGFPVVRSLALTVSDLDRSIELFQALDFRLQDQDYLRGDGFAFFYSFASARAVSYEP